MAPPLRSAELLTNDRLLLYDVIMNALPISAIAPPIRPELAKNIVYEFASKLKYVATAATAEWLLLWKTVSPVKLTGILSLYSAPIPTY